MSGTDRVPRIETTYSTVEWARDGSAVAKTRAPAADARRRFRNELRINRLLTAQRPPVPTPALLAHDVRRRSLTFAAVPGTPFGPKYPHQLRETELDAIIDLAKRLRVYDPRRRWLHRLDSARRLQLARHAGLIVEADAAELIGMSRHVHTRLHFAHGDLTARNVMQSGFGAVLIDWEWAGLYPSGYELAFLWFSLVDVDGGRERVEAQRDTNETAFLLSALLVQLWHLQWYVPDAFRAKHLTTRDQLIDRLLRRT